MYNYCKGAGKLSQIETITFSRTPPANYEKEWPADVNNSGHIMGYLDGSDVTIVGETIRLNKNSSYMFANRSGTGMPLFSGLSRISGLNMLDTSQCESMSMMFYFDDFLEDVNGIAGWDTGQVDDMSFMFTGCTGLRTLPIGLWDVGAVENFDAMFQGRGQNLGDMNIEHLDLSCWDTRSAKSMSHMFYGCSKLRVLDLSNWDVSHVETFSHMLADCYGLEEIKLEGWSTRSAKSFDAMFNDCHGLRYIDVANFETGSCKQFSQMFEACRNLEHIDGIEAWDVSNASEYAFSETFHGCRSLKDLDLSRWVAPHPDSTFRMFKGCESLAELDLSGINMATVESSEEMFDGCSALIKCK